MPHIRKFFQYSILALLVAGFAYGDGRVRNSTTVVASQPAAPVTEKQTPFVTVLFKNWNAWDTDHDGILSDAEIDHAVVDPSVKGNDAAAAASLKLLTRTARPAEPLTKQYFQGYNKIAIGFVRSPSGASAESLTSDPGNPAPTTNPANSESRANFSKRAAALPADWDMFYSASLRRIARRVGPTWRDQVALEHLRQGPLGDCFFVATLGAVVNEQPKLLQRFIEPLPDGTYVAHFPSTQPIVIPPLTDGQLAISSTSASDGAWVAVLEQAFGKYRASIKGTALDVDGTDSLWRGGNTGSTIHLLTGHDTSHITFPKTVRTRQSQKDAILPKLRTELTAALAKHRLVTAGVAAQPTTLPTTQPSTATATTQPTTQRAVAVLPTTNPATIPVARNRRSNQPADLPPIPPNINTRHAYAVLAYDAATDVVEIWNPHGQQFRPKGPPGLQNGYATDHGRFKLPLTEAYAFFTTFTFEVNAPAKDLPTTRAVTQSK